ncbi:hypothetical protein BDQ12DRAFT_738552 [Crucibulum laeve]|uniref:CBM1 domain-containing protein n=1 Tax=Crucibulum laeve TaxID=68775 RepID=A0A5C3LL12_9AGAR|nr:hypothetical protein BDQ12DRAFT_738552 [Crucibulum laeve]
MLHFSFIPLAALLAVVPAVSAQATIWAQCGGKGWSGATTCVSGTICTVLNDYFSQCIPGVASSTASSTTKPVTSSTSNPAPTGTSTEKVKYWFSL